MSANTASFEQTRRQASTLTTAITIIALLLGWGLKTFVEGQTRSVTIQGITADVPAGWIVRENAPIESAEASADDPFQMEQTDGTQNSNLVFITWNPLHPERHYSVSLYAGGTETTLPSTAAVRALNRSTNLKLYRILEETPILVNGNDGYKVTFVYVDPGDTNEIPTIIQGIDYYFAQGEQTLVITLETENENPAEQLAEFLKFAETVEIGVP